jgi:hypothetical protein
MGSSSSKEKAEKAAKITKKRPAGRYSFAQPGRKSIAEETSERMLSGYLLTQSKAKKWERRWCVIQPSEAVLLIYTIRGTLRGTSGGALIGAVNLHNAHLYLPEIAAFENMFSIRPQPLGSVILNMLAWPHKEPESYTFRSESKGEWAEWTASLKHFAQVGPQKNVRDTNLALEGWLQRKNTGRKVGSKWARRWFVLDPTECALFRFDSNGDDAPITGAFNLLRAEIKYNHVESITDLQVMPTEPISRCGVRWQPHQLQLRAQSAREAREWVRALSRVTGTKCPITARDNFKRAIFAVKAMAAVQKFGTEGAKKRPTFAAAALAAAAGADAATATTVAAATATATATAVVAAPAPARLGAAVASAPVPAAAPAAAAMASPASLAVGPAVRRTPTVKQPAAAGGSQQRKSSSKRPVHKGVVSIAALSAAASPSAAARAPAAPQVARPVLVTPAPAATQGSTAATPDSAARTSRSLFNDASGRRLVA